MVSNALALLSLVLVLVARVLVTSFHPIDLSHRSRNPVGCRFECRAMHPQQSDPFTERKLFYSQKNFPELGLSSKLTDVLSSLSIQRPSKIQALSFYGIKSGKPCIIADQTGSGKTLAYLLPTIQRMLDEGRLNSIKTTKSPFLVIMTPTTELTLQVAKVVKTLANALKFRTACFTSTSDLDHERKRLRLGADVVVSTPGQLLQLLKRRDIDLSELRVLVLDEVDVLLMDQSFPLQPIGENCSSDTQFLFTTATLPEEVVQQIRTEFPDVMSLKGPGLHRIAPNVEEVLVDCNPPQPRMSRQKQQQEWSREKILRIKCAALLKAMGSVAAERTLVFCNTIEQCRRVENLLRRDDRQDRFRTVYSYHGAIDAATREESLRAFTRSLLRKPAVMICTDRASRGMDFNQAHVDHVVLFDFPQEPSEYLRRVGRTGRAGRPGTATVLAYGKQLEIARTVMRASVEGQRINPAPAIADPPSASSANALHGKVRRRPF